MSDTPTAKAPFDASNFGIYKGVFVGSSGTIVIDVSNDGAFAATMIVDNVTYKFTTSETAQNNQPTSLDFTNGSNSFTFTVSASGSVPTILNLVMSGHNNPALIVAKETSTALVKCFEGTFSGGDNGVINFVLYNNIISGISQSNSSNTNNLLLGTVTNGLIAGAAGTGVGASTFAGTLSGNNASGTWLNTNVRHSWLGAPMFY